MFFGGRGEMDIVLFWGRERNNRPNRGGRILVLWCVFVLENAKKE